jgi:hypothetical protein
MQIYCQRLTLALLLIQILKVGEDLLEQGVVKELDPVNLKYSEGKRELLNWCQMNNQTHLSLKPVGLEIK